MNTLTLLFTLMQAAGAVVGAGGSVFAELFYLRAVKDGAIDEAERAHLSTVAGALRIGMLIYLIGSVGMVIMSFAYLTPLQPALTHTYWIQAGLVFAILFFAWALSRKLVSFTVGSAGVFAGWWFITFLVFEKLPAITFGAAVGIYLVATAVVAAFLYYVRTLLRGSA